MKFFKVKRNADKHVGGNGSLDSDCLRREEEEEQGEGRRKKAKFLIWNNLNYFKIIKIL